MACDCRSQTGEHEFETVRTGPAMLEDLFRRRRPDRVVIEVGPAAGWITDLTARMNIELQVANPSHQVGDDAGRKKLGPEGARSRLTEW